MDSTVTAPRMMRLGLGIAAAAVAMVALCAGDDRAAAQGGAPPSSLQDELRGPRDVFTPVTPPKPTFPKPSAPPATNAPSLGIAGATQNTGYKGNPTTGRNFAFDNCRPCHIVAPNQKSPVRFANAPDFRAIAKMPSTTELSLNVWLTNPHPTMPSLVLSPRETADVIAYILSLRTPKGNTSAK